MRHSTFIGTDEHQTLGDYCQSVLQWVGEEKKKKIQNFGSIQVLDRDEFAYAKLLSFFVKVNAMWMLKLICQQFFPVFSQRHRDVMLVKNTLIYMYIVL